MYCHVVTSLPYFFNKCIITAHAVNHPIVAKDKVLVRLRFFLALPANNLLREWRVRMTEPAREARDEVAARQRPAFFLIHGKLARHDAEIAVEFLIINRRIENSVLNLINAIRKFIKSEPHDVAVFPLWRKHKSSRHIHANGTEAFEIAFTIIEVHRASRVFKSGKRKLAGKKFAVTFIIQHAAFKLVHSAPVLLFRIRFVKNVEFFVMDAENMKFPSGTLFDVIWAIESISHFPHKEEFFRDAVALLKPGGKFILADWFQSEGIKHEEREKFIEPIERGMLTPRIEAMSDYERLLKTQGIEIIISQDVSNQVSQTWDEAKNYLRPFYWLRALINGIDIF
ncbi:MAG: Methyltransferase, partial [Candidatus Uhrbacteria bacterium GW2011_GWC2_53_7]